MSSYKNTYPPDAPPPPYPADGRQYVPAAYPAPNGPPSTQPDTSSVAGPSSGGIGGFMRGLTGQVPSDLLNPPPPSFSRPPRRELPYTPFAPLTVVGIGTSLDKGFPAIPPPAAMQPHPFATHDVCEDDWVRFVGDIQKAGKLSPMNRIVAGVAPLAMGIGLAGFFVSRAIEARMKRSKSAPATQIVDHWNHYFFWPRGMEVDLIHGRHVYTERETLPADLARVGYMPTAAEGSDLDSDVEEERRTGAHPAGIAIGDRRSERRARREDRRSRRRDRRDNRSDERNARQEPWKLVITYRPPA
ncbi:DUF4646 domain-containing protein [Phanerochaete sordida]|uniref:DUF4646 domain-containing protein n=1 Tax=Phanerochaete sordida TaxID=48140 RepID=A0A9P3GEY8_9APHY|nr:DUF4646 domain-containing protein [Phanerochaete sordida]